MFTKGIRKFAWQFLYANGLCWLNYSFKLNSLQDSLKFGFTQSIQDFYFLFKYIKGLRILLLNGFCFYILNVIYALAVWRIWIIRNSIPIDIRFWTLSFICKILILKQFEVLFYVKLFWGESLTGSVYKRQ